MSCFEKNIKKQVRGDKIGFKADVDGKKFDLSNEKTELRDEEKSLINKLFSNVGIGSAKIN